MDGLTAAADPVQASGRHLDHERSLLDGAHTAANVPDHRLLRPERCQEQRSVASRGRQDEAGDGGEHIATTLDQGERLLGLDAFAGPHDEDLLDLGRLPVQDPGDRHADRRHRPSAQPDHLVRPDLSSDLHAHDGAAWQVDPMQ